MDLGTANGRYFLLFAGIGADAKITTMIENHFLKRLGLFSYIIAGAVVGLGPLDYHMRLRIDGRRFRTAPASSSLAIRAAWRVDDLYQSGVWR